jgi:hypothetical protein
MVYEIKKSKLKDIPVDWLRKKYCNKGVIATEKYMTRMGIINEIIKEWREENDKSRSD